MSDSKIENLPIMTTPDTATLIPVEDVTAGNVTKQVSVSAFDNRWLNNFNVKNYGAKGDNSTDDTTAIQNAINAAGNVGGIVFFPNGTYVITDKLTLKSGITIQGESDQFDLPSPTCMVKQTVTNKDIFYGSDVGQVTFRNLCMQGTGSGNGIGIDLVRSTNTNNRYFRFENLYIRNTGGDGVYATNMIVSQFDRVITESCVGDGIHLVGLSAVAGTSVTFNACYGNGNLQSGFHLDTMIYCSFQGCASDACGIAYWFKNCQGISLQGCGCESINNRSTNYPGIPFKIDGSNGIQLHGCYQLATLASGKGIWLTNTSYGIGIFGHCDVNPGSGAKWLFIDSGSVATVCDPFTFSGYTNNGTVTFLNDSTGSAVIPGPLYTTLEAPTIRNWNGWEDANESWAYASATTITVPTGAASKYRVGDKIKLTQTTVKYFYIVAVADTLLTVTGGTDYTVANAAISANFYSHFATPIGFPGYFNYTPTITAGSGTFTTTVAQGRFSINGRTCHLSVEIAVTTHGTAAQETRYTLPVNAASSFSGDFEHYVGSGLERFNTGDALITRPISATVAAIRNYINGFDGADGSIQDVTLSYEI